MKLLFLVLFAAVASSAGSAVPVIVYRAPSVRLQSATVPNLLSRSRTVQPEGVISIKYGAPTEIRRSEADFIGSSNAVVPKINYIASRAETVSPVFNAVPAPVVIPKINYIASRTEVVPPKPVFIPAPAPVIPKIDYVAPKITYITTKMEVAPLKAVTPVFNAVRTPEVIPKINYIASKTAAVVAAPKIDYIAPRTVYDVPKVVPSAVIPKISHHYSTPVVPAVKIVPVVPAKPAVVYNHIVPKITYNY